MIQMSTWLLYPGLGWAALDLSRFKLTRERSDLLVKNGENTSHLLQRVAKSLGFMGRVENNLKPWEHILNQTHISTQLNQSDHSEAWVDVLGMMGHSVVWGKFRYYMTLLSLALRLCTTRVANVFQLCMAATPDNSKPRLVVVFPSPDDIDICLVTSFSKLNLTNKSCLHH